MARELTHCYVKTPVKPLDEASLAKLRALERKLGVSLIAFAVQNDEYAPLTEDQRREVEALGHEISAAVVAYSNRPGGSSRPRACGL